jgi:hypothetical protein
MPLSFWKKKKSVVPNRRREYIPTPWRPQNHPMPTPAMTAASSFSSSGSGSSSGMSSMSSFVNRPLCYGPKCFKNKRLRFGERQTPHPWVKKLGTPTIFRTPTFTPNPKEIVDAMKLIKQHPAKLPGIKSIVRDNKLFPTYPTKTEIRQLVQHWSRKQNNIISKARRTGDIGIPKASLQVDWALAAYMRDFSLRAPAMPIKARDPLDPKYQAPPRYLYRGVSWSVALGKSLSDASYMSWSTNPQVSAGFGLSGRVGGKQSTRVYRLDISSIPHGTPWIWFSGKGAQLKNGWNISFFADNESEVILPPGTLTIVGTSKLGVLTRQIAAKFGDQRATIIDVRYTPNRNAAALWVPPGGRPLTIFK